MVTEASSDHYDLIVVGAGMGGLTVSSLLAKSGKKVLLVEKEHTPGGYVRPLVSGSYQFDTAARLIMGCGENGPFGPGPIFRLLNDLGVKDQCEFIKVQPFATMRFSDMSFQMWSGRREFLDHLRLVNPTGFDYLPAQFDLWNRIYRGVIDMASAGSNWDLLKVVAQYPDLARYRNSTVESALLPSIPDATSRAMLSSLLPYIGLPSTRASFLLWATMMASYIDDGAYFCKGGLHRLADAVAGAFSRSGGELLLDCKVNKLIVRNRQVQGVLLETGQEVFAPQVISNIDCRDVFNNMIDRGQVPGAYLQRLSKMEPSFSVVDVSLVTDLDLPSMGYGFETLFYVDPLKPQASTSPGTLKNIMYTFTLTTAVDGSLAPHGQHLVSAALALPPDANSTSEYIRAAGSMLYQEIIKNIPELPAHLIRDEMGSPAEGYYVTRHSNIYGWAATPGQIGINRLAQRTPVKGLYLVGHWARMGHGVITVVLSGIALARMLLKRSSLT